MIDRIQEWWWENEMGEKVEIAVLVILVSLVGIATVGFFVTIF